MKPRCPFRPRSPASPASPLSPRGPWGPCKGDTAGQEWSRSQTGTPNRDLKREFRAGCVGITHRHSPSASGAGGTHGTLSTLWEKGAELSLGFPGTADIPRYNSWDSRLIPSFISWDSQALQIFQFPTPGAPSSFPFLSPGAPRQIPNQAPENPQELFPVLFPDDPEQLHALDLG